MMRENVLTLFSCTHREISMSDATHATDTDTFVMHLNDTLKSI